MRSRLFIVGLIAVASMSLAACGGNSPTNPPATQTAGSPEATPTTAPGGGTPDNGGGGSAPDAGAIVTADMAASIIGGSPTKVDMPGNPAGGPVAIASYLNTNGDDVTVLVEVVPGGFAATALAAAMAAQSGSNDMVPVSGLGDSAGKVVDATSATLAFVKGDTIVVIAASASGSTGLDLELKLEAVARQILSRL